MQQFTIPQFIDVEDKIIGPVTTRQFVIMLAGAILIAISYKIFDFSLFLTVGIIILALSGVFAFAKINGMPFHFFILNLFQTLRRTKLRVWQLNKKYIPSETEEEEQIEVFTPMPVKHYTASRLAELALIVDTKGVYRGEDEEGEVKIKMIK